VYNPQTGRYYLPKLGTSKGIGDVFRGGFRMPLEGSKEARAQQEREFMSRSLTDLQFTASNVAPVKRDVNPNRQYKWTGNIQMVRDNPHELWRPHVVKPAEASPDAAASLKSPASTISVGFDARAQHIAVAEW
jgi:hypothetical protein